MKTKKSKSVTAGKVEKHTFNAVWLSFSCQCCAYRGKGRQRTEGCLLQVRGV